jgi:hypothetical protein
MFLNFFRVLFFISPPLFQAPLVDGLYNFTKRKKKKKKKGEKKKPFLILFLKCGLGISLLCV